VTRVVTMRSVKQATNAKKDQAPAIAEAVDDIRKVYKHLRNTAVAQDPAVKALIQGLMKVDNDFKVAGLTVATLRNVGIVPQSEQQSKGLPVKISQNSKEKEKVSGPKPMVSKQKSTNMRSFTRSIDYLVATGILKEDDSALLELRENLRKNKDEEVSLLKSGTPITRKISEIGDFDLLYLRETEKYESLMERIPSQDLAIGKDQNGYTSGIFQFWNRNGSAPNFLSDLSSYVQEGKPVKIFSYEWSDLAQQLKGPVLDLIIKELEIEAIAKGSILPSEEMEVKLYHSIATLLSKQPWFKFGKSPSLEKATVRTSAGSPQLVETAVRSAPGTSASARVLPVSEGIASHQVSTELDSSA